mmetsp:Transcript_9536/g.23400  ORF Transcript_9536/g.23400 Transcript_9536/m.23400 type:complete len:121 (+) Transcript_9536:92-454(+)|eukprot:CAMPEP_0178992902 /NCGR_PEP_ID=MMETSP0795-20121207/6383_1 /TAXON_ID=88552 /ORGANISM="Amoebophrya sp., Strain Ameob2" /LENGTH=120 /DNA_ID=CAMNT_0020684857 /DNA_START=82 /DNA_END=444 /DNA_ORIENTATION=+
MLDFGVSGSKAAVGTKPAQPARTSTRNSGTTSASTAATTSMTRASAWAPEVEDLFRLQQAGWKTLAEYTQANGPPDRWEKSRSADELIMKTKIKANGFFVYWKKERECTDANVKQVKIYT